MTRHLLPPAPTTPLRPRLRRPPTSPTTTPPRRGTRGTSRLRPAPTSLTTRHLLPPAPTTRRLLPPRTNNTPPAPPCTNDKPLDDDAAKGDKGDNAAGKRSAPSIVANPHAVPGAALILDGASWSARNPDDPAQPPPKQQKKVELTEAEKAELRLKRELKAKAKEAYQDEIAAFEKEMTDRAEELAKRFEKKPANVKQDLRGKTSLAHQRSATLHNAKLWRFSKEINADREPGEKIKPPELQRLLKEAPEYQDMTEEEEALLLQEHAEHKGVKKSGTRLNNAASSRDCSAFARRIEIEATLLYRRTGALAFLTIGRSDVNDTIHPLVVGAPEAMEYFPRVLHTTNEQFALRFDNWGCNKDAVGVDLTYSRLRRECTMMITDGLERKVNKRVEMRYKDYDRFILDHGFELQGWPESVEFMCPSDLGTVERLRPLYDALISGSCRWERLTPEKRKEIEAALPSKPKKTSGKKSGKAASSKRKRDDDDDDDEVDEDSDDGRAKPKKRRRTNLKDYTTEERADHKRKMERDKKARQRKKLREEGKEEQEKPKKKSSGTKKRTRSEDSDDEPPAKKSKSSVKRKIVSRPTIDDTDDDANANEGYSPDEKAKALKRLSRRRGASARLPSPAPNKNYALLKSLAADSRKKGASASKSTSTSKSGSTSKSVSTSKLPKSLSTIFNEYEGSEEEEESS
ncbi:hypothetical protein B0H16DRAFT_1725379 [Mycena metata]|uniref:Uncharacterized protein n=1 Tax=Mycena metata TaxID=1033252 RepID=A0AAD7IRI0_9AGAR|nr:hypothetical protein B0H16DRAFT_1725379 [Mycena metata]